MRRLSQWCFAALLVGLLALYLPALYDKAFVMDMEKTHLLYSPTLKQFIWKEKVLNPPAEARAKAEDHHAEFVYRDESGHYYSREEFERNLPFIYYKNMELWGLLPLEIGGQTFDAAAIRENRRVLELKSNAIHGRAVDPGLYPLLESNPGQARLVFPEDRYRLTPDGLEFINADRNEVDEKLSRTFTAALEDAGFRFPARFVAGKHTILKAYDAGHFIVDATGAVFHLKRVNGEPRVFRTPIDPALGVRHIEVSESRNRDYYGLLLTEDDRIFLLREQGYALVKLPLKGYAPERMDFKVIVDPLYYTAVYSDDATIQGMAATLKNGVLHPVRQYTHTMSRAARSTAQIVRDAIFPFSLSLEREGRLVLKAHVGSRISLVGIGLALAVLAAMRWSRSGERFRRFGLVLVSGIFGLAASAMAFDE
ncbi:DUF4857 domain-containing protein [Oceanidesulfovibrio indonesiensis]|uniref:DUF4857 domain-containing protein n=1 Tax=Oceanidesulfovibrio indonesiensis TaxID=54767 RepID=A0A7M3MFF9_9BACT|nr:DUF4857 domain-containing protein [Oceanidesulfovibrio indonesiensis]TVM17855.1 DUF4857 domain-containing protein [Oceanidesulfovibrio indonesiensis]